VGLSADEAEPTLCRIWLMKMTVQFILAAVPVIFLKAALIKRAWPATCTAHNNTLSQYLDATSYNHHIPPPPHPSLQADANNNNNPSKLMRNQSCTVIVLVTISHTIRVVMILPVIDAAVQRETHHNP
jgi:hypothetical protein